jgi:Uma2 family endonuclease
MSDAYEEIVDGQMVLRFPPNQRHETICSRLHAHVARGLTGVAVARLVELRSPIQAGPNSTVRPDLALVTIATGKLFLAAEVISSDDHHTDTVMKKQVYEDANVPRLWMIDPRYHNVEIYHGSPYGLTLKGILAGRDILSEQLLPELKVVVDELFAG